MDGVLADLSSAFRMLEEHLFGPGASAGRTDVEAYRAQPGSPRGADGEDATADARQRRDAVWKFIRNTPDFWTYLRPTAPGAVARLHRLALQYRWEVFFVTQRPATEGETVQRQTQRWLIAQGFDMPSVLMIDGSRGAAAGALRLDYHVDDNAQNCVDVLSDSGAKPILITGPQDAATARRARGVGIGVAHSIGECLDILEQVSCAHEQPGMLQRLSAAVGWK